MVLDKNAEPIRNGRRSRGPSPNNHSSDSSDEDEPGTSLPLLFTPIFLMISV